MEKDHIPIIPVPVATTQVNAANQNTRVLMNPAVKNTYSNGVIQQNIQQGINQSLQRHNNAGMDNIVTVPNSRPVIAPQPISQTSPHQPISQHISQTSPQQPLKKPNYTITTPSTAPSTSTTLPKTSAPNSEIKPETTKEQKEDEEINKEKSKWNFRENKLVIIVFAVIIIILIAVIAYLIYRYDPVKFNYMKPPFVAAALPPLKPPLPKPQSESDKNRDVPTHEDMVENATASDIEMLKKLAANNSSKITNLDYDEFLKSQEIHDDSHHEDIPHDTYDEVPDETHQEIHQENQHDSEHTTNDEIPDEIQQEKMEEQPKKSIHDWGDDLDSIIDEADKKTSKKQVKEKEKPKKKYQTKKSKKEDELVHDESELIKAEPKHDDFFDLIME